MITSAAIFSEHVAVAWQREFVHRSYGWVSRWNNRVRTGRTKRDPR